MYFTKHTYNKINNKNRLQHKKDVLQYIQSYQTVPRPLGLLPGQLSSMLLKHLLL